MQNLRISTARELLEREALPVQDVCERVGYADLNFYRALFKRHTGMTPAEYRARFAPMEYGRGELAGGAAEGQDDARVVTERPRRSTSAVSLPARRYARRS